MNRIYKESSTTNTLLRIKGILNDCGIVVYESNVNHPHDNLYSTRTQTIDEQGAIGQNGKGLTLDFALASGYGELMERLENDCYAGGNALPAFMLESLKNKFGFYFFPDEKILSEKEFLELPDYLLDDIFGSKQSNIEIQIHNYFEQLRNKGLSGCIAIPFRNIANDDLVYIPYNIFYMLVGSNGMAAGNTIDEAVYQGTCEIYERYVAALVYYNQLTPPSIPDKIIKEKAPIEYNIIEKLRMHGFQVVVKDFSIKGMLPSVGVLLIKNGKYRLNIGSDTCFNIAISRCLTEVFQGAGTDDEVNNIMNPIPQEEFSYFYNNAPDDIARRTNEFVNFVKNGTGKFPISLFKKKESYPFSLDAFCSKSSYKEEVECFIKKSIENNHNFLIRNSSFLGFPAVHVYIPSISSIGRKNTNSGLIVDLSLSDNVENDKIKQLFTPFSTIFSDEKRMLKIIEALPSSLHTKVKMCELLDLSFPEDNILSKLPVSYFLALIAIHLKKYSEALSYLDDFSECEYISNKEYYSNVKAYLKLLLKNESINVIKKHVHQNIIEDLSPQKLFCNFPKFNCPDCSVCTLSTVCLTRGRFNLQRLIAKSSDNNVDQIFDYLR